MTKILLHSSWEEQSRHLSQVLATVSSTELQADVFAQWVNRGESSDKRLPWQSLSNLYTLVCLHWGIWVGDAMAKNSLRWAVTRVLVWWLWKNNRAVQRHMYKYAAGIFKKLRLPSVGPFFIGSSSVRWNLAVSTGTARVVVPFPFVSQVSATNMIIKHLDCFSGQRQWEW